MQFKLLFSPAPPPRLFHYTQPFLLTGSCFSDHIAASLAAHRFRVLAQPNGVVFNPLSIAAHLQRISRNRPYTREELRLHNELWHSWEHHGCFSGPDPEAVLRGMNSLLEQAHAMLNDSSCILLVTLGTAWVYELCGEEARVVANCHKYPQAQFRKRLAGVEEIVAAFDPFLLAFKGSLVCFTVSPVRHVRDGLVENNLGKAVLLQAVHELCTRFGHCYYFPAYEIVTDELRDYRFYGEDLVHPNAQAVKYVWERFTETCMDAETREFVKDLGALNTMMQHTVMHPGTDAHRRFAGQQEAMLDTIGKKYGLDLR